MRAASISHRDKMELLLEEEADPDIQDNVKIRSIYLFLSFSVDFVWNRMGRLF